MAGRCRAVGASVPLWRDVARQDAAVLRGSGSRRKQRCIGTARRALHGGGIHSLTVSTQGTGEGAVERAEWTMMAVFRSQRWPKDRSARFHAVSFFPFLVEDRITRLDEYWADDGSRPSGGRKAHRAVPSEKRTIGEGEQSTGEYTKTTAAGHGGGMRSLGGLLGIPTETV